MINLTKSCSQLLDTVVCTAVDEALSEKKEPATEAEILQLKIKFVKEFAENATGMLTIKSDDKTVVEAIEDIGLMDDAFRRRCCFVLLQNYRSELKREELRQRALDINGKIQSKFAEMDKLQDEIQELEGELYETLSEFPENEKPIRIDCKMPLGLFNGWPFI